MFYSPLAPNRQRVPREPYIGVRQSTMVYMLDLDDDPKAVAEVFRKAAEAEPSTEDRG